MSASVWLGLALSGALAAQQAGEPAAGDGDDEWEPAAAAADAAVRPEARSAAPGRPALALAVTVERFVERGGEGGPALALEPAAGEVAPGERLVYTLAYENVGGSAASELRITQPLPPGVRYLPGTAVGPGAAVSFSVDGGRTFGAAAELSVPAGDGSRRAAAPEDYTHLRWRLPGTLPPGARGFLRFGATADGG